MTKRPALGKGLSALIGENKSKSAPPEDGGRRVVSVPLERLAPNPFQPRKEFDKDALEELAQSIRQSGVLQPLSVRPDPKREGGWQIIAGERRARAAKMAGLATAPAIVMECDDRDMALLSLIENLQRADLNPINEAEGFRTLADRFDLTQEDISHRVGKSRSAVANALRLLSLPDIVKEALAEGRITAGHGRALLALPDEDIMSAYGDVIGAAMSVRQTEEHVRKLLDAAKKMKEGVPAKTQPPAKPDPNMAAWLLSIGERLGTKVFVRGTEAKGKIEIPYTKKEDRDRILEIIGGR